MQTTLFRAFALTGALFTAGTLQEHADLLAGLARTDHLTGIANRRTADAELARACARAATTGERLSLAILDLDRFKSFNDTFGHVAGDQLLVESAKVWRAGLGERDVLARYGGEEFIVILPGRSVEEAVQLIDRVRRLTPAAQTFSAGVAEWDCVEAPEQLTHRADVAMYVSKNTGRARTTAAAAAPRAPELLVAG